MSGSNHNKERSGILYRALNQPWIYKLIEAILAPDGRDSFNRKIRKTIESFPTVKSYLDVGCGPRSWLTDLGLHTIGMDISLPYIVDHCRSGNSGVVASAVYLPIERSCFDAVWAVGLLHHLTDSMFVETCSEMLRVCRPGGYVAILDAVKPHSVWARPIPALLRKLDRGRYMRDQEQFESLAANTGHWSIQRYTYSHNGLEAVFAIQIKE